MLAALALAACHPGDGSQLAQHRLKSAEFDNLYQVKPTTSNLPMVNTFVTFEKRGRCLVAKSSNMEFTPVFVTAAAVSADAQGIHIAGVLMELGRRYEFVGATGSAEDNDEIRPGGCPGRTMSIPGVPEGTPP